jgi:hypothetical protein
MEKESQFRQGDVFLRRVEELPDGVRPVEREGGRIVLAHGEVTGHAHAILAPTAQLYAHEDVGSGGAPRRYLGLPEPVALQHEEHRTIQLPAGTYEVVRQREYQPEANVFVAD